jgi:hypothetical protein
MCACSFSIVVRSQCCISMGAIDDRESEQFTCTIHRPDRGPHSHRATHPAHTTSAHTTLNGTALQLNCHSVQQRCAARRPETLRQTLRAQSTRLATSIGSEMMASMAHSKVAIE